MIQRNDSTAPNSAETRLSKNGTRVVYQTQPGVPCTFEKVGVRMGRAVVIVVDHALPEWVGTRITLSHSLTEKLFSITQG